MDTETGNELVKEMEFYFGKDIRRIQHAHKVLKYARKILESKKDNSIDELVIIAAAILHDIGIHACERKYDSTAGYLQEKEGPFIAGNIMKRLNLNKEVIDEVCHIVARHHSPGKVNTLNFKILYDADQIVNLEERLQKSKDFNLDKDIDKLFLTEEGKRLAREVYYGKEENYKDR